MGSHSALRILFAALVLWAGANAPANASAGASDGGNDQPLDEIVVTATLRSVSLEEMPGSVSVLTGATLRDAGQQHFEDFHCSR